MDRPPLDRLGRTGPLVAVVAVLPAVLDQASVDGSRGAWLLVTTWAAATLVMTSMLVARPLVAACGSFAALGGAEIWASAAEIEVSFADLLPVTACLFAVGALASIRATVIAATVVVAGTAAGTVANRMTADLPWQGGVEILAGVLLMQLALVAGLAVRSHRAGVAATEEALVLERRARELAEAGAAARERTRLAREMHDIVAHSVTLLVVNAETIRARRDELPAWVGGQADAMADAGRRATEEMHALLAVLRDGVPMASADHADLSSLVDDARRAGADVELSVAGTPVDLPHDRRLAVYRVVQEGLSNARRYAPGGRVTVRIGWRESVVDVEVAAEGDSTQPGSGPGTGSGLAGLAGRVAELGGSLTSGFVEGRHVLLARLPHDPGGGS